MPIHHKHHHHHHHHHERGLAQTLNSGLQQLEDSAGSIMSIVFVTATPTFTGSVAGYTTLAPPTVAPPSTSDPPVQSSAAPSTTVQVTPEPVSTSATLSTVAQSKHASTTPQVSSSSPSAIPSASSSASLLANSSPAATSPTPTSVDASAASASQSVAPTSAGQSSGMSGGAIAGIVIAVILALIAATAVAAFLYRRKRNSEFEVTGEEKNPFGDNAAAPAPVRSVAARPASPTPMSMGGPSSLLGPNAHLAAASGLVGAGAASRVQGQDTEKSNPFGNHAAVNPNDSILPAPLRIGTPGGESAAVGGTAATFAQRHSVPKPLEISRSMSPGPQASFMGAAVAPSPARTEFSVNSVSSNSMTNGTVVTNVHRIQLDFKPSMDDELELTQGQLVRLLHEYDDGWALCIRLDRSRQGVAPRTCLSTRPVKPRMNPSTGAPPQLRLPIQGATAPAARSASPTLATRPNPPMSPPSARPQQRSMSPGPYGGGPQQRPSMGISEGRLRSNSDTNLRNASSKPLGPSPMNPNATTVAQGVQNAERAPMQIQAVTAPGSTPPRSPVATVSPVGTVARKPVPGLATSP